MQRRRPHSRSTRHRRSEPRSAASRLPRPNPIVWNRSGAGERRLRRADVTLHGARHRIHRPRGRSAHPGEPTLSASNRPRESPQDPARLSGRCRARALDHGSRAAGSSPPPMHYLRASYATSAATVRATPRQPVGPASFLQVTQDTRPRRVASPSPNRNRPALTWRRLCPLLSWFADEPAQFRPANSAHSSARSPIRRLPTVPGPTDRPIVDAGSTVTTKHAPFRSLPPPFRLAPA